MSLPSSLFSYRHQSGNYDGESSESEVESDLAREIREESCRIQKEIELERKANKIRETTPKKAEQKTSSKKTPKSSGSNGRTTSQHSSPSKAASMSQSLPSLQLSQVQKNLNVLGLTVFGSNY